MVSCGVKTKQIIMGVDNKVLSLTNLLNTTAFHGNINSANSGRSLEIYIYVTQLYKRKKMIN